MLYCQSWGRLFSLWMHDGSARLSMLFTRKKFPYHPSLQSYNCERVLNFIRIYLHFFLNLYFLHMRYSNESSVNMMSYTDFLNNETNTAFLAYALLALDCYYFFL